MTVAEELQEEVNALWLEELGELEAWDGFRVECVGELGGTPLFAAELWGGDHTGPQPAVLLRRVCARYVRGRRPRARPLEPGAGAHSAGD